MNRLLLASLLASPCWCLAATGHAHVHGVARLDIAVEQKTLTLQLDSPLDNLLGFERAPRTDAERRQATDMIAKLNAADRLFRIDPSAGCSLKAVELTSAALKLGTPDPAEAEAGHADLDGTFTFSCTEATRAAWVDTALFDFKPLRQVTVQVATPTGQFKRDIQRPAARIPLAK